MKTHVLVWLGVVGIVGCGSSAVPPPESPRRVDVSTVAGTLSVTDLHTEAGMGVRTLPAAPDAVWQALPLAYERLEIPEAGVAPDGTRMFGARDVRPPRRIEGERLSTFLDCGMGITATPRADEYQVSVTLITRVEAAAGDSTRVFTTLEASARPRATSGNPVSCRSNGRLETRVGDILARLVTPGGIGH